MSLAGHNLTIGYSDRVVGRGLKRRAQAGGGAGAARPERRRLLKTLLGILAPQAGEVAIGGRLLAGISIRERARLIAYVPQVHVPTFAWAAPLMAISSVGRRRMTGWWPRGCSTNSASHISRRVPIR
jgi:iron complex transport system ATP-binding protein